MWQQNLINNLIVFFVLGSIFVIIYLKMTKKTLVEFMRDFRGGLSDE